MKISKENLLQINELKLSGRIEKMNETQIEDYCNTLDLFIEGYPSKEAKIKSAFEAKDYASFSEVLLTLKDMLAKIYADDLVQDCVKLATDAETARHEKLEAYLTYFLTAMSMLSIDIQMSQHKEGSKGVQSPQSEAGQTEGEGAEKSILAVDDVSFFLNMLKSALKNTTYKLTAVTSGEMALRYLMSHTPDLFILDIEMPKMDGYELAKKIRESGQKAPIIFLTGNSTKEYVLKAIQTGAADFIVKPINTDQVIEKIKKFLG